MRTFRENLASLAARSQPSPALSRCLPPPTIRSSRASTASTSSSPISILPPPKSARGSPAFRRPIANACFCNIVIENELMAGAGEKDSLDKAESFPGRAAISSAPRAARRLLRREDQRRGDRGRRQEDLSTRRSPSSSPSRKCTPVISWWRPRPRPRRSPSG